MMIMSKTSIGMHHTLRNYSDIEKNDCDVTWNSNSQLEMFYVQPFSWQLVLMEKSVAFPLKKYSPLSLPMNHLRVLLHVISFAEAEPLLSTSTPNRKKKKWQISQIVSFSVSSSRADQNPMSVKAPKCGRCCNWLSLRKIPTPVWATEHSPVAPAAFVWYSSYEHSFA